MTLPSSLAASEMETDFPAIYKSKQHVNKFSWVRKTLRESPKTWKSLAMFWQHKPSELRKFLWLLSL